MVRILSIYLGEEMEEGVVGTGLSSIKGGLGAKSPS